VPSRREAASAGNSMMAPMSALSNCRTGIVSPATGHH
jgi:hypothetical protein